MQHQEEGSNLTFHLKANMKITNEDVGDDKKTYISTLDFYPVPMHNGQELKCEVAHDGYSMQQIEEQVNVAKASLQLECKSLK